MNAWITAGQSIQFASKLANAKVAEVKSVKSPKSGTPGSLASPPIEFGKFNLLSYGSLSCFVFNQLTVTKKTLLLKPTF